MFSDLDEMCGRLAAIELIEQDIENDDLIQRILGCDMTDKYEHAFAAELAVEASCRGLTDELVKACEARDGSGVR